MTVVEVPQADVPYVTNVLTSDGLDGKEIARVTRTLRKADADQRLYIVDFCAQFTNSPRTSFELLIDE